MIAVTVAAAAQLKAIQVNHPQDPIVRVALRDLDDTRLSFTITLEATAQPDDVIQQVEGLTIAVSRQNASRMGWVTIDYTEAGGFRFLHDGEGRSQPLITIPTLN